MVFVGLVDEYVCLMLFVFLCEVMVKIEVLFVELGMCDGIKFVFIGFFLGGFYVIWLVEWYGFCVVMFNFVICFEWDFVKYVGE